MENSTVLNNTMKMQSEWLLDKTKCPICKRKLIKKSKGKVCKHHHCPLYWKNGKGFIYIEK